MEASSANYLHLPLPGFALSALHKSNSIEYYEPLPSIVVVDVRHLSPESRKAVHVSAREVTITERFHLTCYVTGFE